MKKEKRVLNIPVIVLSSLGGVALMLLIFFIYMSMNGKNYTPDYNQKIQSGEIQNPITEFSLFQTSGESIMIEQSILEKLNNSNVQQGLIKYSSVILKLYNLHNIPFTSITPKILIYIDNQAYNVEIKEGNIFIMPGEIQNEDIILITTSEEILKMSDNSNYAKDSVSSGKTSIEFTAGKIILFAKGYLSLYKELNS